MMASLLKIILSLGFIIVMGCASSKKSVGLGAGLGAIAGGIADPGRDGEYRTRNVIVGSALGAVMGSIISEENKKVGGSEKKAFPVGSQKAQSSQSHRQGNMPALTQPKVRTEWIEGHTINNRYVEGHFEYIIEESTRWEED